MALGDLVPCYYTGQRVGVEPPAESRPRLEVRELKRQKLGKFVFSGKFFLFFKAIVRKAVRLDDGPLGVGNALPFFKVLNALMEPNKLHYTTPMANDIGIRRWGFRSAHSDVGEKNSAPTIDTRVLRVSARSRHSQQFIAEAIRPLAPARLAGSF